MFRISITLSLVLGIGANCVAQNRLIILGVTNQGQQAEAEKSTARLVLQSNANSESLTLADRK